MSDSHSLTVRACLMLVLMVFSILTANFLKHKGIHWISETSLYVFIGLLMSVIYIAATHGDEKSRNIQLETDFFYMVLLPPIIFEGGLTLQRVAFLNNLAVIATLALLGAMYSTVVTSGLMYIFTRFLAPDWSLLVCLLFGAIISSTDPVSVLGMLPPSTDRNLYMLIVGESALNDAVSIILYRFFSNLLQNGGGQVSLGSFTLSLVASIGIFIGSTLVGIVVALLYAKLSKEVRPPEDMAVFQLLMLLVFAYICYLGADLMKLTGIISIFVCGLAMAHYAFPNLSKVTVLACRVALRSISSMCDSFVFLYIGLGLFAFGRDMTNYDPLLILCGIISVLISRTHVFIISFFNNAAAKINPDIRKIPGNQQIFLWFCGLRGAVSFALARETLDNQSIDPEVRAKFFGTAILIVFCTVVGMGGLTPYMLRTLNLDGSSKERSPQDQIQKSNEAGDRKRSGGSLQTVELYMPTKDAGGEMDSFWKKVLAFDRQHFKPYFTIIKQRKRERADVDNMTIDDTASILHKVHSMEEELEKQQLGDSDDDELDKVPISLAAEMFGIGSNLQSGIVVPSPSAQIRGRSRSNSTASFMPSKMISSSKKLASIVGSQDFKRSPRTEAEIRKLGHLKNSGSQSSIHSKLSISKAVSEESADEAEAEQAIRSSESIKLSPDDINLK